MGGVIIFGVGIIILFITKKIDGIPAMHMEPFPRDWFGAASALANIIFAFNFQMNFFPIFKGLKDASDSKMEKACLVGLICCAVPYLTVGFIGYSMAGDNSKANFLESIPYNDTNVILFYVINASYIFSILFAIVLMFFGCRNNFISIVNILRRRSKRNKGNSLKNDEEQDREEDEELDFIRKATKTKRANREYIIFTVLLYLVMVVASIFLDSIELIFNFLGAICETLVELLLPAIFYVMLIRK